MLAASPRRHLQRKRLRRLQGHRQRTSLHDAPAGGGSGAGVGFVAGVGIDEARSGEAHPHGLIRDRARSAVACRPPSPHPRPAPSQPPPQPRPLRKGAGRGTGVKARPPRSQYWPLPMEAQVAEFHPHATEARHKCTPCSKARTRPARS